MNHNKSTEFCSGRRVVSRMFSSIIKFLRFLENPEHPCLGPNLWLLKLIGVWHPELKSFKARFKLFLCFITIIFFFTQYIKCALAFNVTSLQLILQYVPFHLGVAKICFFQKDYKEWERLIKYISSTEIKQMLKKDAETDDIMKEYIERSRRVTYFFWTLAFFSNFSIFSEPYLKNEIVENGTSVYVVMFDGYTPFSKEPPGYYFSMLIQTILGNMMSAYIVAWDMLTVSVMIFFIGQLKMSRHYCVNAIDPLNNELSQQNIAECHHFHTSLVKYQKKFNKSISRVMFIYLIVISVNLGVCIIQISEIEGDLQTQVSSGMYIVACLVQLLLFYWHSNEVTVESQLISYATFESKWPDADKSIQKQVALLGLTTNKRLVFNAGPLNEMSLSTFITILRGSYSFFTLLRGTH